MDGAKTPGILNLLVSQPALSGSAGDLCAVDEGLGMDRTEALATLKRGVEALSSSAAFLEYLDVASRFHNYSMGNRIMIWSQRKDASHVAGFNAWREMGRFVKKGEKGIAILAPMVFKRENKSTGAQEKAIGGFRVVHVFDVSQTEGQELPTMPTAERLTGDDDGGIFTALLDFAMHGGLKVQPAFDAFPDERNGDYNSSDKEIRIRSGLSILQRAKTMAHECAHWILHTSDAGRALDSAVKETEAEACAYLALARFGFPSDAYSFPYIAGWAGGDVKILERSLSRISKAADEIVFALEARLLEMEPQLA